MVMRYRPARKFKSDKLISRVLFSPASFALKYALPCKSVSDNKASPSIIVGKFNVITSRAGFG
jgi:hypothetical protein